MAFRPEANAKAEDCDRAQPSNGIHGDIPDWNDMFRLTAFEYHGEPGLVGVAAPSTLDSGISAVPVSCC